MADSPLLDRVRTMIEPIASDLQLEVYDLELRGGTLRVVLDTPPGSDGGVDLDTLALATRIISREFDHNDPMPGSYTLEVSSPGVERSLRTPAHFQREVGKLVSIRLSDVAADQRRVQGELVAADDSTATIRVGAGGDGESTDRTIHIDQIDRAKTVFEWGPQPKKGSSGRSKGKKKKSKKK